MPEQTLSAANPSAGTATIPEQTETSAPTLPRFVFSSIGHLFRGPLSYWLWVLLLLALVMALGGWILTFWIRWAGWALIFVAIGVMIGLVIWLGKGVKFTRYRPRAWTKWDLAMVAFSIFPMNPAPPQSPWANALKPSGLPGQVIQDHNTLPCHAKNVDRVHQMDHI